MLEIENIIKENDRRNAVINAPFDPISGKNSIGERVHISIPDFPIKEQWIPKQMLAIPLVKQLCEYGSLEVFILKYLKESPTPQIRTSVVDAFVRLRCRYDFPFWAASFV